MPFTVFAMSPLLGAKLGLAASDPRMCGTRAYAGRGRFPSQTRNIWPHLVAVPGLPGLCSYGIVVTIVYISTMRRWRYERREGDGRLGGGRLGKRRRRWKETLISTVCWLFPSRVLCAGPSSLSPGSLLQALDMRSTLGLGVAAMQGAPCRFFPIAAASFCAIRYVPTLSTCNLDASQPRYSGKCEVRIPTCLEITG